MLDKFIILWNKNLNFEVQIFLNPQNPRALEIEKSEIFKVADLKHTKFLII